MEKGRSGGGGGGGSENANASARVQEEEEQLRRKLAEETARVGMEVLSPH